VKEARKESHDQQTIVEALKEKIAEEKRFDGKWVLQTNISFSPVQAALKYKEPWQKANPW